MRLLRPTLVGQPGVPWWDTLAVEFDTVPIITPSTNVAFPQINVSGAWKTVTEAYVCVSGTWKTVSQIQICVGNTWKDLTT